jgi:hypothetical protein
MDAELRRQFYRNKEKLERTKATTASKRWRYVLGATATSLFLFVSGAALESFTKFFKDSIPSQLKDGLCYMSDLVRSNDDPHQFTVVVLPFSDDAKGNRRDEVAKSFRSTKYDVNVLTPCEPVLMGIKGGKLNNKRAYSKKIEDLFEKYRADLIVRGEVKQKVIMLNGYTNHDVKEQMFLQKGRINPDLRDVTETFDKSNSFNPDQKTATKFLQDNIVRTLEFTLRRIKCSDLMPMECVYGDQMSVPADVMLTISKIGMVFFADTDDQAAELEEWYERQDYYEELSKYQEDMKGTPTMSLGEAALPVMLNLIYRHGQTAFVGSDGSRQSLFGLGNGIIFAMANSDWKVGVMSGLFSQRNGEVCRSEAVLRYSIDAFRGAIDIGNQNQPSTAQQFLAWLWLGRSQAMLYAWGEGSDRELVKRELPETVANLDRLQVDWKREKLDDADVVKIEAERAIVRGANERMKSGAGEILSGLNNQVNWVLDADIQGFFDAMAHSRIIRFLEHRIADAKHFSCPDLEDSEAKGFPQKPR